MYKIALKCQKVAKKLQKCDLELNTLLLKCFSEIHDTLDLGGISTTQTRLLYSTFSIMFIEKHIVWKTNKPPKCSVIQKDLEFELQKIPKHSRQVGLTWKVYDNN